MGDATIIDWVPGDRLGLKLPAHPEALKAGGPAFLTQAFRASGALAEDNEVTAITRLDEWLLGGTGTKVLLSVTYKRDAPGLSGDLFVKFSRNFTDKTRDSARHSMEPEVRLANLSRNPAFPIAVPQCVYADFHHASGSGILVTERIAYGQGSVEPHHHKCMDQLLPDPLAHYRALVSALALLSGTHKAGRLGVDVERDFPFDLEKTVADGRIRVDEQQLAERIDRLATFIARYPHLVPPHLADRDFLDGLRADVPLLLAHQDAIRRFSLSRPDMIALCHWNANIDNAWFWRETDGTLKCGLIDWGSVGQLHVCQAIWGSVGGSEPDVIEPHLGELLDLFIADYARAGGPALDRAEVERHLELQVLLGLPFMTTAPRAILREVPDPALAADRYDPVFTVNETARVQLKSMINFLNMWHRRDLGRLLRGGRTAWQN